MNERIEINPLICHGSPVIRGTRVMVAQVLGALSGGDTIETVLADYPSLTTEDLSAVVENIPFPIENKAFAIRDKTYCRR